MLWREVTPIAVFFVMFGMLVQETLKAGLADTIGYGGIFNIVLSIIGCLIWLDIILIDVNRRIKEND